MKIRERCACGAEIEIEFGNEADEECKAGGRMAEWRRNHICRIADDRNPRPSDVPEELLQIFKDRRNTVFSGHQEVAVMEDEA